MERYKVAISTVGCRANQADSARIAGALDLRFVELLAGFEGAQLAIVNTCCVTAEAERDCRKAARSALAASPGARVILTGCAVSAIDGFGDGIDGRVEKRGGGDSDPGALADWINRLAREHLDQAAADGMSERPRGRTRALLKIQNGCSHGCAYCIVPRARGRERSVPSSKIYSQLSRLAQEGFGEVVLTGVQLGAWGTDLQAEPRLDQMILKAADMLGPGRLRLSSIEPWAVDSRLIEAVAGHARICNHLHLPLQSGDDRILAAMGRGYTASDFLRLVERTRRAMPDAAIGTDVLLGFPGEDERAFEGTVEVLRQMEPAYVHAFSFSPRPGTRAATMSDRPARQVARRRVQAVRELGAELAERYREDHVGQTREVIVEERQKHRLTGLTDTFVRVMLYSRNFSPGELVPARLGIGRDRQRLLARPV